MLYQHWRSLKKAVMIEDIIKHLRKKDKSLTEEEAEAKAKLILNNYKEKNKERDEKKRGSIRGSGMRLLTQNLTILYLSMLIAMKKNNFLRKDIINGL